MIYEVSVELVDRDIIRAGDWLSKNVEQWAIVTTLRHNNIEAYNVSNITWEKYGRYRYMGRRLSGQPPTSVVFWNETDAVAFKLWA